YYIPCKYILFRSMSTDNNQAMYRSGNKVLSRVIRTFKTENLYRWYVIGQINYAVSHANLKIKAGTCLNTYDFGIALLSPRCTSTIPKYRNLWHNAVPRSVLATPKVVPLAVGAE